MREITGRLLELDLASKSFRIHGPSDEIETVVYSEPLEPRVMETLNCFVRATVVETDGHWELASLEAPEGVPAMRFHERRSIDDIEREQGVSALERFDSLGMPDGDGVPLDQFQSFIKRSRWERAV